MTKRIYLLTDSIYGQHDTTVELDDTTADLAVQQGLGELAAVQVVWNHDDERQEAMKQAAEAAAAAAVPGKGSKKGT